MAIRNYLFKSCLPMVLFAVVGICCFSAEKGYAQEQRIVFPDRMVTVEGAFRAIEKQTEFLISFNKSDFNPTRKVRLSHNNLQLGVAMNQILARSNKTYTIRGNHLLIVPARTPSEAVVEQLISEANSREPEVVEEPEEELPDTIPVPEVPDLTKPPVDLDSLERILRERMEEYKIDIPEEPKLDRTVYYDIRDREGFTPGKPAYTESMPKYALRTNLLYAAGALAPNLGAEFGLGKKSTLLAAFGYNGWNTNGTASDNEKLCHWIAQVEYRYWLCETFNGHFLGGNAYYGYYNIAGKKIPMVLEKDSDKYRYKGSVVGGGVSYGYQLMLARRWNLEFNAGVGFGYMKYDKYNCVRCGDKLETDATRTFFAPTKLGISLVFIIK